MVCSMVESGGYLDFGSWAGECITDPDLCASGLTVTMWLRIQAKDINYNSEYQYIISSGAEGESMRGIVFLLKVGIVYIRLYSTYNLVAVSIAEFRLHGSDSQQRSKFYFVTLLYLSKKISIYLSRSNFL